MIRFRNRLPVIVAAAALGVAALAGCGGSSGTTSATFTPPKVPMQQSVGQGEGAVTILAWPGYAEDGSTDKSVDWVTPFEKETGCKATVKYFGTSDEAVNLMKGGGYDVVSASGDATLRLIAAGLVAPVNTKLVPNYANIAPFLKDRQWNSVKGQMYGIPHGWGANLLMYNKNVVKPAPTSWGAVFPGSAYKGEVTSYDSPIYIADAALYLMKHQPDLGIKDPYALDEKQLDAAMNLLKAQKANVSEYWSDYTKEVSAFESGSSVIGTTWQVIANTVDQKKAPIAAILPSEGSTGWSDTWMISSKSQHPNCAYEWMNYIVSPKANAAVAMYFGEAPANLKACGVIAKTDKNFCKDYHVADSAYASKIHYWTTPITQCLDGRTVTCTDYAEWTQRWLELKG